MSSFRSKILLPISREDRDFDQHQHDVLSQMEHEMSHGVNHDGFNGAGESICFDQMSQQMTDRREKWENDIRNMRNEFLLLSPKSPQSGSSAFSSFPTSPVPWSNASLSPTSTLQSNCSGASRNAISFEPSKSMYQRGDDGQVHFQIHFDVTEFKPDDIIVAARNNKLTVSVKHESRVGSSTTTKELSRTIDLPKNVDRGQLSCKLTKDAVLIIDGPVSCPAYEEVPQILPSSLPTTYLPTSNLPQSASIGYFSSNNSSPKSSVSHMDSGWGSTLTGITPDRKLYLEVPVGMDFTPDEIGIKTQDQKLYIHARHEERQNNKSSFREFSKSYDIPANIDPYSVSARLENGILFVQS